MSHPIICFHNVFVYMCKNGHLEIAKGLLGKNIAISIDYNDAFQVACENGHLLVAQWLQTLNINISADNDYAFCAACENGHLDVAQWLETLINADNEYAFCIACENGRVEVAQWLASLYPEKYKIISYGIDETNDTNEINYKIIRKIKIRGVKTVSQIEQCPICLETNCELMTECNHAYCIECIKKWICVNTGCPFCRTNILNTAYRVLRLEEEHC